MNVERALQVVPREAHVTAETVAHKFASKWRIVARLDDGYERELKSFPFDDAFGAAHWLARFDRERAQLAAEDRIERAARRLYVASGGDLDALPWPCKRADFYRKLAKIAAEELDKPEQSV